MKPENWTVLLSGDWSPKLFYLALHLPHYGVQTKRGERSDTVELLVHAEDLARSNEFLDEVQPFGKTFRMMSDNDPVFQEYWETMFNFLCHSETYRDFLRQK